MAILARGPSDTFGATSQVTSGSLHGLIDNAIFTAAAVDGSTTALSAGKIIVKNLGVTSAKIAADAITPEKVDSANATAFEMLAVKATKTQLAVNTVAQSTGTMSLDLDDGNYQVITLSANVTTVDALANAADGKQFTFVIIQDTDTARTIEGWDASWLWQGDTEPTITASTTGRDIISGICVSIGGTVYALATMVKGFA